MLHNATCVGVLELPSNTTTIVRDEFVVVGNVLVLAGATLVLVRRHALFVTGALYLDVDARLLIDDAAAAAANQDDDSLPRAVVGELMHERNLSDVKVQRHRTQTLVFATIE